MLLSPSFFFFFSKLTQFTQSFLLLEFRNREKISRTLNQKLKRWDFLFSFENSKNTSILKIQRNKFSKNQKKKYKIREKSKRETLRNMQLKINQKKVKQNLFSFFLLFLRFSKTRSVFLCVCVRLAQIKEVSFCFHRFWKRIFCIRKYMQSKIDLLLSFKY